MKPTIVNNMSLLMFDLFQYPLQFYDPGMAQASCIR